MGGQACVFYGAAEFSRDTDILLLAETGNLERLSHALQELRAECIAVPPFSADYLKRGHAIHFRCHHDDAMGMRIDVMSVLRGMESFGALWKRRTTVDAESGVMFELLCLPDLVQAKKTQRDRDWLMIRRLVEAHSLQYRKNPAPEQIAFWLKESRTVSLLIETVKKYPDQLSMLLEQRPLLALADAGDEEGLVNALDDEKKLEQATDRAYWQPLKAELEKLRHGRPAL